MHRVFVYGSLMKGYHNHRLLATATFLGRRRAIGQFRMFSLGSFPAVVVASPGDPVEGELYEVDSTTLASLDRLEGHPRFYERVTVALHGGGRAGMYVYRCSTHGDQRVEGNDWRTNGLPPGHEECEPCGGQGLGELEPDVGYLPCPACGGHGHAPASRQAAAAAETDAF